MKKILAVLLAAVMLVALFAACGGGAGAATEAPKTLAPDKGGDVKTAEPTEERLLAIIVPKAVGNNWFARSDLGGKQWASDTGNTSMMVGSNKNDAAIQVQTIQDALALNPDFLSVIPSSPEAVENVLGEALNNGIIVTTQESPAQVNIHYDVEAFNNAEYGAHFFQAALKNFDNMETGKYACFVGTLTSPTHMAWQNGVIDYQKANAPGWELYSGEIIESTGNIDASYAKAKEILNLDPDINAFFGSSGNDNPGIALAIEELGLVGQIFNVGNTMPSQAKAALEAGSIQFASFWDPFETQYVCNVISTMVLNGEEADIKTGLDTGRAGYQDLLVEGKVITGQAWIDVNMDNFETYSFI